MGLLKKLLVVCSVLFFSLSVKAQYYEIANQIPQLLKPALSANFNYRGYAEVSYMRGLGAERVDFLDISTTQGHRFASWLFMGVGAGVDIMFPNYEKRSVGCVYDDSDVGIMVPLYSDFRFSFGNERNVSVNLDLRVGAVFNFAEDFRTANGYITQEECFYLKPALAVRIPINKKKPKQAINVGVSYQLIVADMWYVEGYYDNNKAFNNIGAVVGFEW